MVKMIPPYISPDVKSAAERKLFKLIKESKDLSGFVCLHSLGLSQHQYKRQGEIDFVLVGDGVVMCLEVKGGRVNRKDGVWFFTDRFGQTNSKTESPFSQASSGMYALKDYLRGKFGDEAENILFGYGVLFPDIDFNEPSPEWDGKIVYSLSSAKKPIADYIDGVRKYWLKKTPIKRLGRSTPKQQDLINFLRGDFELATPLWREIEEKEEEITNFTEEQFRSLDHMEDNDRVLFKGGAGTGKTFLAIEKARRLFFEGKKTTLLCFNKLLGVRLATEARFIDPDGSLIFAESIHKYFSTIIQKAGLKEEFDKLSRGATPDDVFNKLFPEFFARAARSLPAEQIDFLIIDEGQDVLNSSYLLALDAILKGGIEKGRWCMFLDPGGQGKMFNRFSNEAYEYLKELGVSEYRLVLNCRNTLQIATQAAIVSGFPLDKTRAEGPKVEYFFYDNDQEQSERILDLLEKLIKREKVAPEKITLLTSRHTGSMCLFKSGIIVPSYLVELTTENVGKPEKGKVTYSSVQAFKGLENSIVIVADVGAIDGGWNESVNYVALTRARQLLYILMDKKLNKEYRQRLAKFAAQS